RDVDTLPQIISLEVDVGHIAYELAIAVGFRSASEVHADALIEHQGRGRLGEVLHPVDVDVPGVENTPQLAPSKHRLQRVARRGGGACVSRSLGSHSSSR